MWRGANDNLGGKLWEKIYLYGCIVYSFWMFKDRKWNFQLAYNEVSLIEILRYLENYGHEQIYMHNVIRQIYLWYLTHDIK
jgi:hypothetical protein